MRRPDLNINYLHFSVRYLTRHKFFTSLHVFGLTLGISIALVIFLFIRYELSFDPIERTYRVNSTWLQSNKEFDIYATPIPLAEVLRREVPGVEKVAIALPQYKSTVAITPEKVFAQEHILVAEPGFLDIFNVEIIRGDKHALTRPFEALISQSTAEKFFGNEDPIGRSFRYRSKYDIKVAGVFRDLPGNTSMPASMLLSYTDDSEFSAGDTWYFGGGEWVKLNAITYVVCDDPSFVETRLIDIASRYISRSSPEDKVTATLSLQPVSDIHLDAARFGGGPWVKAIDSKWLAIFGVIGFAVLFLAVINFINLSTAQAIVRTREAGIRKTTGAGRTELLLQFLMEPLVLVFVSGVLAVSIAAFITTNINQLLGKHIQFSVLAEPMSVLMIFFALLFIAVVAGWYPAWIISGATLRHITQAKGIGMRKTLVVFQFAISAILLTTVFALTRQVNFIKSIDLGFERKGIVNINVPDSAHKQSFITKVKMIPGVVNASLSRTAPISVDHWWNMMGKPGSEEIKVVCAIYADEEYYKVYNLKLISGRIPAPTDNPIHPVIVNEQLLKVLDLGSPDEAVGKQFNWQGTAEIVGVVADFNSEPLHYSIGPALIFQEPEVYSHANIRFDESTNESTLAAIESLWKSEFISEPYEPKILDDEIDSYYKTESTTYTLFFVFAGVAVLISCLGLLGLCVFATVRRVKEISIRKVLGASVENILVLLSSQFMKVVVIACIVATPMAWFSIDFLLGFYAYRIDLTWELLVLPMIVLIMIALITMLTQTIKASMTDPAKNLRSE